MESVYGIREARKERDRHALEIIKENPKFLFSERGKKYLMTKKKEKGESIWGNILENIQKSSQLHKNAIVFLGIFAFFFPLTIYFNIFFSVISFSALWLYRKTIYRNVKIRKKVNEIFSHEIEKEIS